MSPSKEAAKFGVKGSAEVPDEGGMEDAGMETSGSDWNGFSLLSIIGLKALYEG